LSACICRRENYVANTVWKSTKGVRQRISWLTGRGSRSFGEAQDDHFMAQAQRGSRSCQCSSNSFHGGGIPPLPLLNHRRNVQPRRSCSLAVWLKVLRQAELRVSPKSLSRWNVFKARSSGGALHLGLNKDEAAQLPGSARLLCRAVWRVRGRLREDLQNKASGAQSGCRRDHSLEYPCIWSRPALERQGTPVPAECL
jgi:hypothetical protein